MVAVLAGAPVEIAPTAQGIWMRGASVTMLHQPTPRTDLVRWAEETTTVIDMIAAKAVVVSEPFMAAAPVLSELGMTVLTVAELLSPRQKHLAPATLADLRDPAAARGGLAPDHSLGRVCAPGPAPDVGEDACVLAALDTLVAR